MSNWLNKNKIGIFNVYKLNESNNYKVDLSSEFKKYQQYKYSILTFPSISSLNLPEYFLGYRFEESISENYIYDIKLYLKYSISSILKQNIYPLKDLYNALEKTIDGKTIKTSSEAPYNIPFYVLPYSVDKNRLIHINYNKFFLFSIKNDIVFSNNAKQSEIIKVELLKILNPFNYLDFYLRDGKIIRLTKEHEFFYISDIISSNQDSFLCPHLYRDISYSSRQYLDYCILRVYYVDFYRDVTIKSWGEDILKPDPVVVDSAAFYSFYTYLKNYELLSKYPFIEKANCDISEFIGKIHYYGDDFTKFSTMGNINIPLLPTLIENILRVSGKIDESIESISIYANDDIDWDDSIQGLPRESAILNTRYKDIYYLTYKKWIDITYIAGYDYNKVQCKPIKEIYTAYGSKIFNPKILQNLKVKNDYGLPFIYLLLPSAVNASYFKPYETPPSFNILRDDTIETPANNYELSVGIMEVID